jgi:hypothetical protein
MDVNTGGILGMASYPSYDLNNPGTIYDKKLAASLGKLEKDSDAYKELQSADRTLQWRNKCINDTYEPGSTFKPITLATALENNIVNMNTTFTCNGSIRVQGWSKPIYCSNHSGHGLENLKVATGNSCNPAFVTMGLRTGADIYYKSLKSFGLMEVTGIDELGEAVGIFSSEDAFKSNVVSLACYSFGQTFTVTPLQFDSCAGGYGERRLSPHAVSGGSGDRRRRQCGLSARLHSGAAGRQRGDLRQGAGMSGVRGGLRHRKKTVRWQATASAAKPVPRIKPGTRITRP